MATPKRARATSSETTRKKTAEPNRETTVQTPAIISSEEAIRVRAYQLWEREGPTLWEGSRRLAGKAETEVASSNGARTA